MLSLRFLILLISELRLNSTLIELQQDTETPLPPGIMLYKKLQENILIHKTQHCLSCDGTDLHRDINYKGFRTFILKSSPDF